MKVVVEGIKVQGFDSVLPVSPEKYELLSSAMINWVKKHIYWVLPMSGMMVAGGGTYWYMSPGSNQPRIPSQVVPFVQQGGAPQPVYQMAVPCQQQVPCQPVIVCQTVNCQPTAPLQAAPPVQVMPPAVVQPMQVAPPTVVQPPPVQQPPPTARRPAPAVQGEKCPCVVKPVFEEVQPEPPRQLNARDDRRRDIWAPLSAKR